MKTPHITPATLRFLADLAANNDKAWFQAHKDAYTAAQAEVAAFALALRDRMLLHDRITPERPGNALYRIYNDLRFHKHKPPFNPRFAGGFHRVKPLLRGGYYFQVQPGNSYVSCGFFGPNAADLQRIRQDIDHNHADWTAILDAPAFKAKFGAMEGDQLKSAPTGYAKDHPAIHLLRHKQFIFRHRFTDAEVCEPGFLEACDASFRAVRPYFDYMSELLTTDANGEPLPGLK